MYHHWLVLMNKTKSPTRQECSSSERTTGELYLASLDLPWGGYEIVEGTGKFSARWMVPDDKFNEAIDFVETHHLDTHEAMVFSSVYANERQFSRRFA